MKKLVLYAAVALIPLLFFLNVWQSFRYSSLKREVAWLESVQRDLLEKNKRDIAGISVLESPARIEELARKNLQLVRPDAKDIIIIRPEKKESEAHD